MVQDGFTSEGTLFVEDGAGVKSGLRLGVSLAEVVDPTTETGVVNVRFADRTYAKIRDLKIFSTAIASAQAALSEASSTSISNLETTVQLLEDDINTLSQNFERNFSNNLERIESLSTIVNTLETELETNVVFAKNLENRVVALESPRTSRVGIDQIDIIQNDIYFTGTITITNGNVTGVNTIFAEELKVGDTFIATTTQGDDVEFRVTGFDSDDPVTKITVFPTNRNVPSGSRYLKNKLKTVQEKVNKIIFALKRLGFIVDAPLADFSAVDEFVDPEEFVED